MIKANEALVNGVTMIQQAIKGPLWCQNCATTPTPPGLFHAQKQTGARQRSFHETLIMSTSRFIRKDTWSGDLVYVLRDPQVFEGSGKVWVQHCDRMADGWRNNSGALCHKTSICTENIFLFVTCVRNISDKIYIAWVTLEVYVVKHVGFQMRRLSWVATSPLCQR